MLVLLISEPLFLRTGLHGTVGKDCREWEILSCFPLLSFKWA